MEPGSFVCFNSDGQVVQCSAKDAEGVVNPFIEDINAYEEVIVFLLPDLNEDEAAADSAARFLNLTRDEDDYGHFYVRNYEVFRQEY